MDYTVDDVSYLCQFQQQQLQVYYRIYSNKPHRINNMAPLCVAQIKKELKQARNLAYLCKYAESQKMFKKIIQAIEQQIILNNINRTQIQQWRTFQAKIIEEKSAIQSISSKLNGIKNTKKTLNNTEKDTFDTSNQYDQVPRRTHQSNFRSTNRNFSIVKVSNQNINRSNKNKVHEINRDPDVWQPPKLQLRNGNFSVKKPQKDTYGDQSRVRGNVNNGNRPNLSVNKPGRPIRSNNSIIGKPLKGKQNNSGKKTFLEDRYPQGSGPDSNLIQMLQRQVLDKSPNVAFDDIAQLETAKGLLQEAVLLPLKMPQFFTGIRRAWKGVCMFGPPGTGKTLLAKAVASSGGTTFFNVSASSLASKWKGQSQKLVRILFQMAKFYAPSVIFFDQIDALGAKRKQGQDQATRKVKTQLLVQMDGATSSDNQQSKFVIVLAATNRPWDLDEALRRRLQKRIYIPLPTEKGRRQLVKINLKSLKMDQDIDLQYIVKKTQGFSGADITNVCREAAYQPMRRMLKAQGGFKNITDLKKFQEEVDIPLTKQDFLAALKNVNKSVGREDIKKYELWMQQFGSV